MSERFAVAAEMAGPVALVERLRDEWPIPQTDLDREVETAARDHGWETWTIADGPFRRGPDWLRGTDPETGEEVEWVRWQLWCYVEAK